MQLDRNNTAYTYLPINTAQPNLPSNLANKPFNLAPYVNETTKTTIDLTHSFYFEQMQINNGSMNKFATYSSARGLSMSYYDARSMYLGQLALNYTVFDKWFHASFGTCTFFFGANNLFVLLFTCIFRWFIFRSSILHYFH